MRSISGSSRFSLIIVLRRSGSRRKNGLGSLCMLNLLECSLGVRRYRLFGLLLNLILRLMSVLSMRLSVGLAICITESMELSPRK